MKPQSVLIAVVVLALWAAGCAPAAPAGTVDLNVFAAASLTEAFEEIGAQFEAGHPGVTIIFNFAGSQQLAQQISEGAPADVFASANTHQMEVVIEAGLVARSSPQTFAHNRLVVIYPQDNPGDLAALPDLAKPGLKLVFASPQVPVGQYTLEFLDKVRGKAGFEATYKDDVLQNVVSYEDNVRAVLTKVALGEADAGMVYASDISGTEASQVGRLDIPDAVNVIAAYPIAAVTAARQPELAQAFIDLVLSAEGQATLAEHNFVPAAP